MGMGLVATMGHVEVIGMMVDFFFCRWEIAMGYKEGVGVGYSWDNGVCGWVNGEM